MYIQGVCFIVSPSTTSLQHTRPPSAETWRDSCPAHRNDKDTHCTPLFQLLMFPSHSHSVNTAVPFYIAEQTLNMDSITACLSATEPNSSIGTVSTPHLPVQRAQTSNNLCRIRVGRHSTKVATQSDVWEQIWA
jgi:hypothetical protein